MDKDHDTGIFDKVITLTEDNYLDFSEKVLNGLSGGSMYFNSSVYLDSGDLQFKLNLTCMFYRSIEGDIIDVTPIWYDCMVFSENDQGWVDFDWGTFKSYLLR